MRGFVPMPLIIWLTVKGGCPQVLYLHTKGVTARHQAEPAHLRVYQWRTVMSYFLVYHHRAMLRLLDDFDVVGARDPYLAYVR